MMELAKKVALVAVGVAVMGVVQSVEAGPIILSGMDPEDHGTAGVDMIRDIMDFVVSNADNNGPVGTGSSILMLGGDAGEIGFTGTDASVIATGLGYTLTHTSGAAAISAASFAGFDAIYMPTGEEDIPGGMSDAEVAAVNARGADIVNFVNAGGGLAAFAQNNPGGYGWFPLGGLATTDLGGTGLTGLSITAAGTAILSPSAIAVEPFHTTFDGPAGFFGLDVLAVQSSTGVALIIGGGGETIITPTPNPNPNGAMPEPVTATLGVMSLGALGAATRRRRKA